MERVIISATEYEKLRIEFSKAQQLGKKPCSESTKLKISQANKGRKPAANTIANSVNARKGKRNLQMLLEDLQKLKKEIPMSVEKHGGIMESSVH